MQKTFFIWYQTMDLKTGEWKNSSYSCLDFSLALRKLEMYNDLSERRPDLYKDVSCDFEELLEEPEDNTYNDGYDKDDFEGYDSITDC